MMQSKKIRVLVVDDSLVTRKLLSHLLERSDDFVKVGEAAHGLSAIQMVEKLQPDVVSMDIEMPYLNGIEATKRIMTQTPVPIVIVSSLYKPGETALAMEILAAGAVAVIAKPSGPGNPDHFRSSAQYLRTLRAMAEVKVVRRKPQPTESSITATNVPPGVDISNTKSKILVVGASAGGPEGVRSIVSALPFDFPMPVGIVQHIDINFAQGYAQWLSNYTKNPVMMVSEDMPLEPSHIYLSIKPKHLIVKSHNLIGLSDLPPDNGLKPSVAALFRSAGEVYGNQVIAVLLSGMGRDGAAEMLKLKQLGAYTIIQDENSCLVFGMPGEAQRLNAHHVALEPDRIIPHIINLIKKNKI